MKAEVLNTRRKRVALYLNWVFWIVVVTGILILPFLNFQSLIPPVYRISKLLHLISGFVMVVLVVMHIRLENRWEEMEVRKNGVREQR